MADEGRRPLRAYERVRLERLGTLLATTRRAIGLTQEELALRAGLSRVQVARLEAGTRRTRRSTLTRIAAALVVEVPKLGPVERLVADFVDEAGPALAEESQHAERVARRRGRRTDAAYRELERTEEQGLFRWLYERRYGQDRWKYTEEQLDDLAAEMWGYFYERQAARKAQRREIDGLQRRGRSAR
ncbi:MAG: hypothetical protein JWP11_1508 [Frankiales bacterium]|nr:hypothetical protein [Frankiales bacterium]